MTEEKRNKKEAESEVNTFPVPFTSREINENIILSINNQSNTSKEQIINQALKFHSQGNISEAKKYYQIFIDLGYEDPKVFLNYAVILQKEGKKEKAITLHRKSISQFPNQPEPYCNLGIILKENGEIQESENMFRRALNLKPDKAIIHNNLGSILIEKKKFNEAILCFRRAIEIQPDYVNAQHNLGLALREIGELKSAVSCFKKVLEIDPGFSKSYINIGEILNEKNKKEESLIYYKKAVEIDQSDAITYHSIATTLHNLGRIKEASKYFSKILELKTNNVILNIEARLRFSPVMHNEKQIDKERNNYIFNLKRIKNMKELKITNEKSFKTDMFYLAYHNRNDDKSILKELEKTLSSIKGITCKEFNYKDYKSSLITRKSLKIGICCRFLHNHTVGKLYRNVLNDLLKTDLNLSIYLPPNYKDDMNIKEIRNTFPRVIDLPDSPKEGGKLISLDKLDLLFYPEIGMCNYTYILALSRLALVQVNSIGHANTSGLKNIDYFISSKYIEDYGSESNYSEKLIKFNRLPFNYSKKEINKKNLKLMMNKHTDNKFRIGLTQSLMKLHPAYDQILESILISIKDSILILVKDKTKSMYKEIYNRWSKKSKVLIEKSIFLDRLSTDDFINTTKNCHIMLDPFYFGVGNTFYEAMAYGTPFITYPYKQKARIASAGYKQMHIDDPPIAKSPEDYINWCKVYAQDRDLLNRTRKELMEKANIYLFNDKEIYKDYYNFFNTAVKKARDERNNDLA